MIKRVSQKNLDTSFLKKELDSLTQDNNSPKILEINPTNMQFIVKQDTDADERIN